ncbi:MAG: GSCFA domain-containing protein [Pseudomonadota bacterium]
MAKRRASLLKFQTTTKDTPEYRTWFRGEHTNILPHNRHLFTPEGIGKYVLHGWTPEAPVIGTDTQVTAFGSCFAANISNWLSQRNYNVLNKAADAKRAYVVGCGEGMVNSFVILQQFEWAWENQIFQDELWHGYDAATYGYDPEVQAETKRIFDATDVFILTFGLSEIWYDAVTENVFWRTIPKDVYDPERHRFRVSSVAENADNLRRIYALIRKHRPDAKVIFTLSPIPLQATFRNNSCISSNAVSKGVLRVAIDEVVREKADEGVLHYWPSYELITDVFQQPYKDDRRHPKEQVLDFIMTLFERTWCVDSDLTDTDMLRAYVMAGAASGQFPPVLERLAADRRGFRMRRVMDKGPLMEDPRTDKALRSVLQPLVDAWDAPAEEPVATT